jgi:hypothetical protein
MIFYLPKSVSWIIIQDMDHEVGIHIRAIRRVLRDALAGYRRSAPTDQAAQVAVRHYRELLVQDAEMLRRKKPQVNAETNELGSR